MRPVWLGPHSPSNTLTFFLILLIGVALPLFKHTRHAPMSPACLLFFLPGMISRTFMVGLFNCFWSVHILLSYPGAFLTILFLVYGFSDHPNFQASSITIALFCFSSLDFCNTMFWYLSRYIIVYFFIIHFTHYNLYFIQSITELKLRRLLLNVYWGNELLPGRVSHPLVCLIFFLILPIFLLSHLYLIF